MRLMKPSRRDLRLCPITALAFSEDLLLIGASSNLEVWHYESSKCLLNLKCIFGRQAIHGLRVESGLGSTKSVLAWGAHYACVLPVDVERLKVFVG